MNHPTEMANAVTFTRWFYSSYTHAPLTQSQRDYASRLQFSFLLDNGASISVLNYPTYITIAKLPNIKQTNILILNFQLSQIKQKIPFYTMLPSLLNTTIETILVSLQNFLQSQV